MTSAQFMERPIDDVKSKSYVDTVKFSDSTLSMINNKLVGKFFSLVNLVILSCDLLPSVGPFQRLLT